MTERRTLELGGKGAAPLLVSEYRGTAFRRPRMLLFSLGCGVLTGGLLWLCYFPVAWGWLAWAALVPLLALVRTRISGGRLVLSAWAAGLVFYWPILQWMRVADYRMYATWAGLAMYCSLFFPVAIAVVRRLDRKTRLPLIISFPAVWTALEYFRGNFLSGFSWYFLGHSQHDWLHVTQISDVGGAYAVTFLVAAVNALVLEGLQAQRWFRSLLVLPDPARAGRRRLVVESIVVVLLLSGAIGYGSWRLEQTSGGPGPRIALLQGNTPQSARNDVSSEATAEGMFNQYAELSDRAMATAPPPALLIWPETSFPGFWSESPAGHPDEGSRRFAREFARRWHSNVLLGLNAQIVEPSKAVIDKFEDATVVTKLWYNSALLIGKDGKTHGRYDKIHRVPFGEYVPLREVFPWMDWFAPYDFDYSVRAGERLTLFPLEAYRFGALICYEDTDPYLARQYVETPSGEKADFLVNISNDGWFNGTSEHEEHLAICRFRAIECRRAVVRSVNMGISAIVDSNGRVLPPRQSGSPAPDGQGQVWEVSAGEDNQSWPISKWHELKKTSAVVSGSVPIDRRVSVYARFGDWLPGTCWVVVIVALVLSIVRPIRRAI
jgi:apolipoprotein N-acyltransferase